MKVISAEEAAALIQSGSTLALSGSGACNLIAEKVLKAIETRFIEKGRPRELTIFHPQGMGDQKDGGVGRFAHDGMTKRVIGGHWGMSLKMGRFAIDEKTQAYNFPQGVMAQMMRAMAAKTPGVITKIGLGTYIDPRQEGGKMNEKARESDDLVEVVHFDGEEWLRYKPVLIDVAILRGTSADEDGYISCEEEVHFDELAAMAGAAKNNGGIVIVQVKYLAKGGSLDVHSVKIPGYLVDYVVVDKDQRQTWADSYEPYYCGRSQTPVTLQWPDDGINERKVIARRQAMALHPGEIVNIGTGVSTGVPTVLDEEGAGDLVTFSLEQGQSGGLPVTGLDAGTMVNPRCILDQPAQHDLYHGGVLGAACLSAAEVDFNGNVNVSRLNGRMTGCGGFIDISQETPVIVFGGTLCTKSKVVYKDGKAAVVNHGARHKFVNKVGQITFSGDYARKRGKKVIFVTDRCVFELTKEGIMLTEIAPGLDIENDIINDMDYRPLIASNVKIMPDYLFQDKPFGLRDLWNEEDNNC